MPKNSVSEVTCPVCTALGEGDDRTFARKWNLALHIAVEAKMCRRGDQSHRKWFLKNVGRFDFRDYKMNQIAKIAQFVYPVVKSLPANSSENPKIRLEGRVRQLEEKLHDFVKSTLQKELGESNDRWWYDGVPPEIRKERALKQEEEKGRKEKWDYLYLSDLPKIVNNNLGFFQPLLKNYYDLINGFTNDIWKLNHLRNDLAHPTGRGLDISGLSRWLTDFEKKLKGITQ